MRNDDRHRITTSVRWLPLILGVVVGCAWAGMYLFLGRLHGMWGMFDEEFPFFFAASIGVRREAMSILEGASFASIDGALIGFLVGFLLKRIVLRGWPTD